MSTISYTQPPCSPIRPSIAIARSSCSLEGLDGNKERTKGRKERKDAPGHAAVVVCSLSLSLVDSSTKRNKGCSQLFFFFLSFLLSFHHPFHSSLRQRTHPTIPPSHPSSRSPPSFLPSFPPSTHHSKRSKVPFPNSAQPSHTHSSPLSPKGTSFTFISISSFLRAI